MTGWRAALETAGYAHVHGVLDQGTVDVTLAAAQHVLNEPAPGREDYPDGFRSTRTGHLRSGSLRSLATQPFSLEVAVGLFGTYVHCLGTQVIALDPLKGERPTTVRTPVRHGWHRDVFHLEADLGRATPRCAVKLAFWLTDAPTHAHGGTRFLPGSHLVCGQEIPVPAGAIDPKGAVTPPIAAGDVTVFENRTAHAGGVNTSSRTRWCVVVQIGYRWLARVGPALERSHASNPLERALFSDMAIREDGVYAPAGAAEAVESWIRSRFG